MKLHIWKSRDRKTVWRKEYRRVDVDGTVEVWVVEKTSVLHPATQQVVRIGLGIVVRPKSQQFYNKRTMEPVPKRTHYYTFSQSSWGGPGAKGDRLGGFNTGQFGEILSEDLYRKNVTKIKSWGFKEVK